MNRRLLRVFLVGTAVAALTAVILVTWALASVRADTPETYDDIAAHYKYGSIGSEPGGPRTGTIIPVEEVGTDRHRLEMWTPASAAAYNAYGEGHDWKFSHFRSTRGYVSVPLDGIWLRAPYLHNGSVPTLTALLNTVELRPTHFWRGYDVYDPDSVGFVTEGPAAQKAGTRIDTSVPGNSNAGHTYGTTLPADSKRALIEYLKTR